MNITHTWEYRESKFSIHRNALLVIYSAYIQFLQFYVAFLIISNVAKILRILAKSNIKWSNAMDRLATQYE